MKVIFQFMKIIFWFMKVIFRFMQVIFQFMEVIFNKKKSVILVATTICMQCLRADHALSSD